VSEVRMCCCCLNFFCYSVCGSKFEFAFGLALSTNTLRFERRVHGICRYHIVYNQTSAAAKLFEGFIQPGDHKLKKKCTNQPVPYWEPKNMKPHHTKFSHPCDSASGFVSVSLLSTETEKER